MAARSEGDGRLGKGFGSDSALNAGDYDATTVVTASLYTESTLDTNMAVGTSTQLPHLARCLWKSR